MHKGGSRSTMASAHDFAMIPRAEIPRSSFKMQKVVKTAFGGRDQDGLGGSDVSWVYPILVEEVLPGDTFNLRMTAFCRLATPIFPVMDNLYLDSHFFFVPNRLVWDNWDRFCGERRPQPGSSIDLTIPTIDSPAGGYAIGTVYDYMGLPTVGQGLPGTKCTHSALPLRGYSLIYNEWYRHQDLLGEITVSTGDGPDLYTAYKLFGRAKRHDYFTGCLPWPQKGGVEVALPLTGNATVKTSTTDLFTGTAKEPIHFLKTSDGLAPTNQLLGANSLGKSATSSSGTFTVANTVHPSNLYADLATVTAVTINQLRQSFQIQRLLERDARGGTRYTEIIRAHFGVISPDARLQRPEYLGGDSTVIIINPIAQTSATDAASTPQGNLSAMGTGVMHGHGFSQSFTEHGYIFGLISVRGDYTYQQGLRRHWSRATRYDYYWPVFAHLGEQAVLQKEIWFQGNTGDNDVFGYQERWAEYRYIPSEITGLMRSTAAGTIDAWHLSQNFTTKPTLSSSFMAERPPVSRITAVGAEADGQQFLLDAFFDITAARPMPMYSVPGLIDHF